MWLPTLARDGGPTPAYSASPSAPPRACEVAGSHVSARAGAIAQPERARGVGEASARASRQIAAARNGRTAGSTGRMHEHRAGAHRPNGTT